MIEHVQESLDIFYKRSANFFTLQLNLWA